MGLRIEYFAASDDIAAARLLDADDAADAIDGSPRLTAGPIDPVVLLGSLEEFVVGRSFEEQLSDPDSRRIVADQNGGARLIIRIDDALVAALGSLDRDRVPELAGQWASAEEFGGEVNVALLEEFIGQLSHLSAEAVTTGHLYCLVEV